VGKPSGFIINLTVARAYRCYGITLSRDGGAHAIGARHGGDDRFHLFDANYGHFVAKTTDGFKDFLDWYFANAGYKDRYDRSVMVTYIKPPVNLPGRR
jgi:hypothetical protein